MFVTGLEFLPVNSDLTTITSNAEAAVLSISVDNHLCLHTLNYRSKSVNKSQKIPSISYDL